MLRMTITNRVRNAWRAKRHSVSVEPTPAGLIFRRGDDTHTFVGGAPQQFVALAEQCLSVLMQRPAPRLIEALPELQRLRNGLERIIRMAEAGQEHS